MGKELVDKMLPVLQVTKWPESTEASELGRKVYYVGLDKVDEYTGNPKTLTAALRTFLSGESRPFAYAGVAYTVVKASREPNGSYDQNGLEAALEWLEKAQELAPDLIEINMIEAFIYIYGDRLEDARIILDYLEDLNPSDYHVLIAEAEYWAQQDKQDETIHWLNKAILAADTVPRKLRLRAKVGDVYLASGQNNRAIEIYKEAVHFAKENPTLWHRLSIAYWRLEDFDEAERCNQRALSIRDDYPEALKLKESIDERKRDTGSLRSRLLGWS
ncbi:MAG: tetratricopeptide repeat protein [Candidatus Promineifilaceae bacterium]|jgi:tetratricopeptide (TPR) repeat protein